MTAEAFFAWMETQLVGKRDQLDAGRIVETPSARNACNMAKSKVFAPFREQRRGPEKRRRAEPGAYADHRRPAAAHGA